MIKLAVDAQLPLIGATTRDTVNLLDVLKHLLNGKKLEQYNPANPIQGKQLYVFTVPAGYKLDWNFTDLYTKFMSKQAQLILINSPVANDLVFNVGEVPTPREMLLEFMEQVTADKNAAQSLLAALGGTTIKEAAELARLTMARDKSLTAKGIMLTRKSFFQGSRGLTLIDTAQSYYEPDTHLVDWLKVEAPYFLKGNDIRLRPRGLMFDGPPGTGKTAGAKFLAEQMGIPLYRFDLGGVKQKYVGESEQNMLNAMSALDHEEPCVALLDEIEKLLGGSLDGDAGTTSTMFSQMLWWLAERRSRVLVVMTTNALKKLPPELYREGRIDEVMWFGGLEPGPNAINFVENIIKTFNTKWTDDQILQLAAEIVDDEKPDPGTKVSQAKLTTATYQKLKKLKIGSS